MATSLNAREILVGEYHISTFVTGGSWKENTYLIRHVGSGEMAVIDPGEDEGEIAATIQSQGGRLKYILLTHGHHDHVGGVAALGREHGICCYVHPEDLRLLHHAPMYALRFAQRKIEKPEPYCLLDDAQDLNLGAHPIGIIKTPGHTMGSVCYVIGGAVFTGDTLFFEHVGRVDLPGANASLLPASIGILVDSVQPSAIILPGHGRTWSIAEASLWWLSAGKAELPQYTEPSKK